MGSRDCTGLGTETGFHFYPSYTRTTVRRMEHSKAADGQSRPGCAADGVYWAEVSAEAPPWPIGQPSTV